MFEKYKDCITKLRVNANSNLWSAVSYYQAPHKPLLLLSVLDLYAQKNTRSNLIKISDELEQLFNAYWEIVFPNQERRSTHSYSLPFFHLSTEENSFWHLVPIAGKEAELSQVQKLAKLANTVRFSLANLNKLTIGARLDGELHELLFKEQYLDELRKAIVKTYFDAEIHPLLNEQSKNNILYYRMQKNSKLADMNGKANSDDLLSKQNLLRGQPLRELTNVNTQVRRLAYFPALLGSAARQNYNYNSLAMRLQSWGKNYQEDLNAYLNMTGNVVPKRKPKKPRLPTDRASHAAKRYVDFAENIGWLNQISGLYTITRPGRVLLTAREAVMPDDSTDDVQNAFDLNEVQKLFFISELWRKDGDVLFTLLGLLSPYPVPLKKLQEQFGERYQQHLEEKYKLLSGERVRREMRERINNIKTWTNPVRYAEQFIPTRMNWLLDLGLVQISKAGRRECRLTPAGIDYKLRLPGMESLGDEWYSNRFFKSVAYCFILGGEKLSKWMETDENKRRLIVCLRAAFKHLRRPPVPKFSLSQVIFFVCLTMAIGEGILIDYNDVLQSLSTPIRIDNDHIAELRRAARENESYLILNPI